MCSSDLYQRNPLLLIESLPVYSKPVGGTTPSREANPGEQHYLYWASTRGAWCVAMFAANHVPGKNIPSTLIAQAKVTSPRPPMELEDWKIRLVGAHLSLTDATKGRISVPDSASWSAPVTKVRLQAHRTSAAVCAEGSVHPGPCR